MDDEAYDGTAHPESVCMVSMPCLMHKERIDDVLLIASTSATEYPASSISFRRNTLTGTAFTSKLRLGIPFCQMLPWHFSESISIALLLQLGSNNSSTMRHHEGQAEPVAYSSLQHLCTLACTHCARNTHVKILIRNHDKS